MSTDPRIDAYIAKAAPFAQPILSRVRARVHAAAPQAEVPEGEAPAPIELPSGSSVGAALLAIFEQACEAQLIQPTLVYDYPVEASPLSKNKPDDPNWVERFEIYAAGMEIANAYSELNDPQEQRRRFLAQVEKRDRALVLTLAVAEMLVRAGERVALLGLTPPLASRKATSRIAEALAVNEGTEALKSSLPRFVVTGVGLVASTGRKIGSKAKGSAIANPATPRSAVCKKAVCQSPDAPRKRPVTL